MSRWKVVADVDRARVQSMVDELRRKLAEQPATTTDDVDWRRGQRDQWATRDKRQ